MARVAAQAHLLACLDREKHLASEKFGTEQAMETAELAQGFIHHPYWERITRMLNNMEKAEFEALLDPTQNASHALNRASVVICRKVAAMPFIDIEQGRAAVKAVEEHSARLGGKFH